MARQFAGPLVAVAALLAVGGYCVFHTPSNAVEDAPRHSQLAALDPAQAEFGQGDLYGHGRVEAAFKSDYSNIRVRKLDTTRTLSFVRDNGEEVVESMVNLARKQDLLVTYTRYMFLSYLFRPAQEKVLIVGLGGGSMVQFLKHYDKDCKVDVLEIDPVIVKVADRYFDIRDGGNVKIMTRDGFKYLHEADAKYDTIYMDAFLKPSADTDSTGYPLRLKTIKFYKEVQKRLTPDGLVVFNINPHEAIRDDLANIKDAFPQMYVFDLPGSEGLVVVGSMNPQRVDRQTLLARGAEADQRFRCNFSFREMARHLQ